MDTVQTILERKGKECFSVTSKDKLITALELLKEKNIGAVTVIDNQKIVGIFSERDLARKILIPGTSLTESIVSDFMSTNIITVIKDMNVLDCMNLMTDKHIRHLPVVEIGQILGIISIGDIVHSIINAQITTIKDLEKYITG